MLIGKSIFETLLVASLAVFFFLDAFPHFQGWAEVTPDSISGWVVNTRMPWQRVEVQLFVDGEFIGRAVASQSRTDVLAAGWSKDEWHGFAIPVSPVRVGYHEARVYALYDSEGGARKTLQLVGHPIPFTVAEDGTLAQPKSSSQESAAAIREKNID